jgi:A/G-specific adenine glycosylase
VRRAEAALAAEPDPSPQIASAVLAWYDRHARRLPWRVGPEHREAGVRPDPYRVWLSEVMLQQTTVAAVKPYFERFVSHWPTVLDLAAATDDDVMRAWAGLGYYSRARNLIAAAREIAARGGRFPDTADELQRLPGVGGYTAAAIAAIAFDRAEPVVDGNVERVIARLFAIAETGTAAKVAIRACQQMLTPHHRAGDYAQAMMDLGATICTPRRPACPLCPLNDDCIAATRGDAEAYPAKADKAERPTRRGNAFVAVRSDGAVLLRRRPPRGLLGGMAEVPGSEWTTEDARPIQNRSFPRKRESRTEGKGSAPSPSVPASAGTSGFVDEVSRRKAKEAGVPAPMPHGAPFGAAWRKVPGKVTHVFTHFRLELDVYRGDACAGIELPDGCWWSPPDELPGEALPSVMKKAIEAALPGATKRRSVEADGSPPSRGRTDAKPLSPARGG